ncbi:MAG: hypothetical protein HRU09_20110 [Oligoflexales bacterium]|nr:hypothetical protein [Oligoflexales bacterium]
MGSTSPFLSLLGAYKLSFSSNLAAATCYSYEFDFVKEGAEQSYQDLLVGKVPGLGQSFLVKFEDEQKKGILRFFAIQKESLANQGILLKEIHHTFIPSQNTWSGIDIEWLPHNDKWTGLGTARSKAQGYTLGTDGVTVISHKIILRQKVKEKLYNGNYLVAVSAINKRRYRLNHKNWKIEKISEELELTALLKDSYLRTSKQDRIANYLNQLVQTKIPNFRYDVGHEVRQVELRQLLTSVDLLKIKKIGRQRLLNTAHDEVDPEEIIKLANRLEASSKHDLPKPVLKFTLKTGIHGLAYIFRVLGKKQKSLFISTDCDMYSDPIDDAKNILLKYTRNNYQDHRKKINLHHNDSTKDIESSFKTFYEAIAQLNDSIHKLRHDPFIRYELKLHNTDARSFYYYHAHKLALLAARTHLLALLDLKRQGFPLEERLSIYNRVKTTAYRDLAYFLEYDDFERIKNIGL